jgi:hypothetical protein
MSVNSTSINLNNESRSVTNAIKHMDRQKDSAVRQFANKIKAGIKHRRMGMCHK